MEEKAWYVVHTQTGYENKVKEHIEQNAAGQGFAERIFQVLIPTQKVTTSKRKEVLRKWFPGYVLVEMILDAKTYWFIRSTTGVTGFLGDPTPTPLQPEEIEQIFEKINNPDGKPKYLVEFKVGESVRIIEGPFKHFNGTVQEINEQRSKLKVMVTVFDRSAPVEVDFLQVEKN